jgi:hypothetical protein
LLVHKVTLASDVRNEAGRTRLSRDSGTNRPGRCPLHVQQGYNKNPGPGKPHERVCWGDGQKLVALVVAVWVDSRKFPVSLFRLWDTITTSLCVGGVGPVDPVGRVSPICEELLVMRLARAAGFVSSKSRWSPRALGSFEQKRVGFRWQPSPGSPPAPRIRAIPGNQNRPLIRHPPQTLPDPHNRGFDFLEIG